MESKKIANRACLFLDRDGVIIEDHGYVYKTEECHIIQECVEIIKLANLKDMMVIVLTNQSGIAKGLYTVDQYKNFENYLNNELKKREAIVHDWFFCPYHHEGIIPEYTQDSNLRKPKSGMLKSALEKYNIDLQKSLMIGDKVTDVFSDVVIRTFLVKGNYNLKFEGDNIPDHVKIFSNHQSILNLLKVEL